MCYESAIDFLADVWYLVLSRGTYLLVVVRPHGAEFNGGFMLGLTYNANYFRAEVERLTLSLTQAVGPENRVQLQRELASARQHLAELEGKGKNV
jgi:hypothetical protein